MSRADANSPERHSCICARGGSAGGRGVRPRRMPAGSPRGHFSYIDGVNMMCALKVPAPMSHGWVGDARVGSPVLSAVANGT